MALGIGRGVAAASLSNGASVVISSSSDAKVKAAVELLKKTIENKNSSQTVTGEAFDMRDSPALTKFLSDNGPFDHLVSGLRLAETRSLIIVLLVGLHCWGHGISEHQLPRSGN